jgi:ABC-type transport system involved in multi-copper enzyme maturation permease subunit
MSHAPLRPGWPMQRSAGDEERSSASVWRRRGFPLAIAAAAAVAAMLWLVGRETSAATIGSILLLGAGVAGGVALLRRLLFASHGIVGVARAVVEEAIGTRAPAVMMLLIAVLIPSLPLLLDPDERLAYRLQFFLSWSLSGACFLLAMVTIALTCGSVCGDIDSQRIHMTLSKPLARWQYLLGKWLGIVLLDGMLLAVIGAGIFVGAIALRRGAAIDAADRLAVDEQVFTARAAVRPVHPDGPAFESAVAAEVERVRQEDPEAFARNAAGIRRRILSERVLDWHTVTSDVVASYLFKGLDPKRIGADVIQLRLKPFADNVGVDRAEVRFAMWLNDRPVPIRNGRHEAYTLPSLMFHTIDIPVSAIGPSGELKLTIANRNLVPPGESVPTSIAFSPDKGLEILYRSGSFGWNFVRGLVVGWAKLAMLAAAALAASSWLAFPTAVLASLMVYVSAVGRAFLADAVDIYTGRDAPDATLVAMIRLRGRILLEAINTFDWWSAAKSILSLAADAFLALVPSFGAHDGVTEIATGRLLTAGSMAGSCGLLAVAYPIVLIALGWALLQRRDLIGSS